MSNKETIAKLKKLHLAATNGPWTWEVGMSGQNWPICNAGAGDNGENYWVTTDNVPGSQTGSSGPQVDAEFIALARNCMVELLDCWEQYHAEKE